MDISIERFADRLRIVASPSEQNLPDEFWERVGARVGVGLADTWGLDRRKDSGAWFEIAVKGV